MAVAPHEVTDTNPQEAPTGAWNVVVWDDPVNLMGYVVYVFRRLFAYSESTATRLMLEVHHEGRSIVAHGPRERAEMDCFRLHRYGLWATVERS